MRPFASVSKLNRHVREQHPVQPLPTFTCNRCGKSFARKEHLKRHERAFHFGDKVQCPLCSARFVEKCRLRQHLLEKHEVFNCEKCGTVVKTRNPEAHICTNDFGFPEAEYPCKFCDKKYRRKGYLVKHLEQFHGSTTNKFKDVVSELHRLESPLASVNKSLISSDKCSVYEYEIGVEYDIDRGKGTEEKKDLFSGVIRLPKILSHAGTKNLIFGKFEIGSALAKSKENDDGSIQLQLDLKPGAGLGLFNTPIAAMLSEGKPKGDSNFGSILADRAFKETPKQTRTKCSTTKESYHFDSQDNTMTQMESSYLYKRELKSDGMKVVEGETPNQFIKSS